MSEPSYELGTAATKASPLLISVVIPMFNESDACGHLFERLLPILDALPCAYEVICVDDGSVDSTLVQLAEFRKKNSRIKIIALARNFGKDVALTAGIDASNGDAVIPLDADLQDPPELIPELYREWRTGSDMVIAVRSDRSHDGVFKRLSAAAFYQLMKAFSETPIPINAGDFRLLDRKVVSALKTIPERNRFMKGLFAWVGFTQSTVTYSRPPRVAGRTKWRPWKLWNFGLEGILSFTTLPLRIWTYLGFGISILAIGRGAYILVRTLWEGVEVPGYASLFVAVAFFSGIHMIGIGIIGEYLGRIFIEVKQRPLYIVREAIGFE